MPIPCHVGRRAIGARYNAGNGVDSGHVCIYNFDLRASLWAQVGQDIDGDAGEGRLVVMSGDRTRVTIGSNTGQVRTYDFALTPSASPSDQPQLFPSSVPSRDPSPAPSGSLSDAPAPVPAPDLSGFCNWGLDGTGASSVCEGGAHGGEWRNASESNCESGCSGRWCSGGGGSPTQPAPTVPTPVAPQNPVTLTGCNSNGGACGCGVGGDGRIISLNRFNGDQKYEKVYGCGSAFQLTGATLNQQWGETLSETGSEANVATSIGPEANVATSISLEFSQQKPYDGRKGCCYICGANLQMTGKISDGWSCEKDIFSIGIWLKDKKTSRESWYSVNKIMEIYVFKYKNKLQRTTPYIISPEKDTTL